MIKYKMTVFVCAFAALILAAATTQAGFEWVPAGQEKPAEDTAQQPAAMPEAVSETMLPEAQTAPIPPVDPVAPIVEVAPSLEALPLDGEKDMETPVSAPPELPLPTSRQLQAILPVEPAIEVKATLPADSTEENKIKVLQITPPTGVAPPPELKFAPPTKIDAEEEIVETAPEAPAPILAPPPVAPASTARKVIMPEDAPATAMENTPGSEKLKINPFPAEEMAATTVAPALEQEATPAPATESVETAIHPETPSTVPYAASSSAPAEPAPAAEEIVVPMPAQEESKPALTEVIGFGSDMPLALALREIVPAEYAFSFGDGVNPGYRVSWNGGKPWDQVVKEMVAPLGFDADIRGNIVHISKTAETPTSESSEKHSALEPAQSQPVDLMAMIAAAPRKNINDPGKMAESQPEETIIRIKEITQSSAPEVLQSLPQDIEPAAASDEQTAEISSQPSSQPLLAVWDAKKGDSLKTTLDQWSTQAGIHLIWDAKHDYSLSTDLSADSSFEEAVRTAAANAGGADSPPVVKFLKDNETGVLSVIMVKDATPG